MAQEVVGHYFAEIGDRFGFTVGDEGFGDDPSLRPPHGTFFVAASDGAPVACGGVREFDGTGEIKRMWVAPAARSLGIAQRLLDTLEQHAIDLHLHTVRLDTNRSLTEAHALYVRNGYREIGRYNDNPYADHWFEKRLR